MAKNELPTEIYEEVTDVYKDGRCQTIAHKYHKSFSDYSYDNVDKIGKLANPFDSENGFDFERIRLHCELYKYVWIGPSVSEHKVYDAYGDCHIYNVRNNDDLKTLLDLEELNYRTKLLRLRQIAEFEYGPSVKLFTNVDLDRKYDNVYELMKLVPEQDYLNCRNALVRRMYFKCMRDIDLYERSLGNYAHKYENENKFGVVFANQGTVGLDNHLRINWNCGLKGKEFVRDCFSKAFDTRDFYYSFNKQEYTPNEFIEKLKEAIRLSFGGNLDRYIRECERAFSGHTFSSGKRTKYVSDCGYLPEDFDSYILGNASNCRYYGKMVNDPELAKKLREKYESLSFGERMYKETYNEEYLKKTPKSVQLSYKDQDQEEEDDDWLDEMEDSDSTNSTSDDDDDYYDDLFEDERDDSDLDALMMLGLLYLENQNN